MVFRYHRHLRLAWPLTLGAFLVAVAVIFFENEAYYRDFQRYLSIPEMPRVLRRVRLTIDFSHGEKRAFEGTAGSGLTAVSALYAAGAAGGFESVLSSRGEVRSIAGFPNTALRRWKAYLNGAPLTDLPGHTDLKPGDRVLLRYE